VFFDFCFTRGLITYNPARQVEVRTEMLTQKQRLPTERLPFTDPEIEKILGALEPGDFWHAATLVSLDTGLRLRDVALLERVSLRGGKLEVATSKGGAGYNPVVRHVLSERTLQSLRAVPNEGGIYFFEEIGRNMRENPATEQSRLSQQFRRLCIGLGIEGKSFHGLRHTFAMRREREKRLSIFQQMAAELALAGVQADLGHRSSETTKIYLKHPKH
ncbi:MAG: site-specific integrase, partial [Candidatus Didemnitutus sp.]|nr:site-specific integrase [Candidatus Didemnitutus sp.]